MPENNFSDFDFELKKAFLLLNTVIFNYNGIDEREKIILEELANNLDQKDNLNWAIDFVKQDEFTAYDRMKDYLSETIGNAGKDLKYLLLIETWKMTKQKGHVTEIEAMAMLKLSKFFSLETEFIRMIRESN